MQDRRNPIKQFIFSHECVKRVTDNHTLPSFYNLKKDDVMGKRKCW